MQTPSFSRRTFLRRASAATLVLGGLPRAAAAVQSASVRLGWLANAQYAGDFVALDKGWFKERGIDLLSPIWHFLDVTPQGRGNWYAKLDYLKARTA